MTLADTRPEVTTPASSDSADLSTSQLEMMRAFFGYEFEVELLDRESMPVVTVEAVDEWIEALEHSGLFVAAELQTMAHAWRAEPEALVSLLIGDVDEVAAKRDVVELEVPGTVDKASFLRAS